MVQKPSMILNTLPDHECTALPSSGIGNTSTVYRECHYPMLCLSGYFVVVLVASRSMLQGSMHAKASWKELKLKGLCHQYLLVCHRQGGADLAQHSKGQQANKGAQVALRQQLHSLKTRMEAAIQLNSSLEPQLQLSSQELMLNTTIWYWHLV